MKRAFLLMVLLAAAAGVSAQQYKWVDRNGRVQYGDMPPAGVQATPLRGPSGPAAPAQAAGKPPLSAADRDAEFRKRREQAGKEQEKQAQAAQEAQTRKANCADSQSAVRTLETGRVSRIDSKGERYYLGDAEVASELARARRSVAAWCN